MKIPGKSGKRDSSFTLDGQLLIAMPCMSDKRFARAVIYVCAHSDEGAMGLIINKPAQHIEFSELLEQLDIADLGEERDFNAQQPDPPIHVGGPVERGRGFVLHSADYYAEDSTLPIDNAISLTATTDILHAIATGKGPEQSLLALGYTGWAPGQLEAEIQANGWLHCPADRALVFEFDVDMKYEQALSKLGVDPSHLVNAAGHA